MRGLKIGVWLARWYITVRSSADESAARAGSRLVFLVVELVNDMGKV